MSTLVRFHLLVLTRATVFVIVIFSLHVLMYVVCFVFIVRLILSIAAVVCLERIVNEIICYVSSSTKNTADLIGFDHSVILCSVFPNDWRIT